MTDATFATDEEFYKANLDKEQEYVRVWLARRVKAGEEIGGMPVTRDGYALFDENDVYRDCKKFLTDDEFAAATSPAEKLALPLPKKDPAEEGVKNIMPVKKDEAIKLGPAGEETSTAPCDGFTFMKGGSQYFLDNQQLMSQFNYAGSRFELRKELLVRLNNEAPLKGFILDKQVTIGYPSGPCTYFPGTFACRSGNEYRFEQMPSSANAVLRLVTIDDQQIAADSQAQLKKKSQEMKARRAALQKATA